MDLPTFGTIYWTQSLRHKFYQRKISSSLVSWYQHLLCAPHSVGGGSEGSEQFVKSLRKASRSQVASQIQNSTHKKQQEAPIAAKFGLGYTYFDIEDTENDGRGFINGVSIFDDVQNFSLDSAFTYCRIWNKLIPQFSQKPLCPWLWRIRLCVCCSTGKIHVVGYGS